MQADSKMHGLETHQQVGSPGRSRSWPVGWRMRRSGTPDPWRTQCRARHATQWPAAWHDYHEHLSMVTTRTPHTSTILWHVTYNKTSTVAWAVADIGWQCKAAAILCRNRRNQTAGSYRAAYDHLHGLLQGGNRNIWLRDIPGHTRQHMVGVRQERLQCCALWGLFWQRQAQPLDLRSQQAPSQALLASLSTLAHCQDLPASRQQHRCLH